MGAAGSDAHWDNPRWNADSDEIGRAVDSLPEVHQSARTLVPGAALANSAVAGFRAADRQDEMKVAVNPALVVWLQRFGYPEKMKCLLFPYCSVEEGERIHLCVVSLVKYFIKG